MFFNKFVTKVKPYTVSTHKAWEVADKHNVLKLDWNELTVPPSPLVKEALYDFASNGLMNWYPNVDNLELRSLLSEYCGLDNSQVEYFGSSDALHEYIIRAFINPGETITMVAPTYDNFRAAAESIGAVIDYFELDPNKNFDFDFDMFEKHIETIAPKIIYLCNPNNPTGTLYQVELLEKILRRFNDVLFIFDEAYYEFVGVSAASLVPDFENVVICRTFSKAFGLASFRVGYAISSQHNMDGLRKIRNPKNISSYAQLASIAALNDLKYMQDNVDKVLSAKKFFMAELKKIGVKVVGSEGGNYVLVEFGVRQIEIVTNLEENNIYVRNYGHVHGMGRYTRITLGTQEQMQRVLDVLKVVC